MVVDYYNQKLNTRVASRIAERLKTGMLGIDGKVLRRVPKTKIFAVVRQNCKKSAVKHFTEKPILNFVDLSRSSHRRCSIERLFLKIIWRY